MDILQKIIKRKHFQIKNKHTIEDALYDFVKKHKHKMYFQTNEMEELRNLLTLSIFEKDKKKLHQWMEEVVKKDCCIYNVLTLCNEKKWDIYSNYYNKGKNLAMLAFENNISKFKIIEILDNTDNKVILDDNGKDLFQYLIENNYNNEALIRYLIDHISLDFKSLTDNKEFIFLKHSPCATEKEQTLCEKQQQLLKQIEGEKPGLENNFEQWLKKDGFIFKPNVGFQYINIYRKCLSKLESLVKQDSFIIHHKDKKLTKQQQRSKNIEKIIRENKEEIKKLWSNMNFHYSMELLKHTIKQIPIDLKNSFLDIKILGVRNSLKEQRKITVNFKYKDNKNTHTSNIIKNILSIYFDKNLNNIMKQSNLQATANHLKETKITIDIDENLIGNIVNNFLSGHYKTVIEKDKLENITTDTLIKTKPRNIL